MLYELSLKYKDLVARYNEAETQEEMDLILAELEAVDETLEDKAEQIVKAIRNFKAAALEAKIEKDFFAAKESANERRADKLDRFFESIITSAGLQKIKAGKFTYSIVTNGGKASVVIECPFDQVPKEFKRMIPAEWEVNNDAIREAEKAGQELPEGIKVVRGKHSVIK